MPQSRPEANARRARRFGLAAAAAVLTATTLAALSPSPAPATDARLRGATAFAFGIGNGMLGGDAQTVGRRFAPFDVVVVDAEEATRADVAAMHARGVRVVLGYLSVGTIERWRSWYAQLAPYRLDPDANWRDEWYADTSRAGYRRAITGDIAPGLLAKGFDGLFLDNVDMIESQNHAAQRPGMKVLVAELSDLAHARGALLFAQNGEPILRRLGIVADLDGWNREDVTWTYDFDRRAYVPVPDADHRAAMAELGRMRDAGLFTTATDYTATPDGRPARRSVANACAVGALPYVSNIGLTVSRLPDPPLVCDG